MDVPRRGVGSVGHPTGAIVAAGSELTPAVCEVVDLVDKPAGTVVHLRVLPGTIEQYRRLLQRAGR